MGARQATSAADEGMQLTADAEARVFEWTSRWRGRMLLPKKNASGTLLHVPCPVRLNALSSCNHVHAAQVLHATQPQQADALQNSRSAKRNADAASAPAGPFANGIILHSSFLRVWKVIDGESVPMHLLGGGSYELEIPMSGRESEGDSVS